MLHRRGVRATPHFAFQPVDVIIALRLERVLVLRCVLCSGFRDKSFLLDGVFTRALRGSIQGSMKASEGSTGAIQAFVRVSRRFLRHLGLGIQGLGYVWVLRE